MSRALLAAAATLAALLGACGDPKLEQLKSLKAEVCACKTAACAQAAMKRVPQDLPPSDHRARQLAKEMMKCLAERYEADRPSTDPDADDAAGSAAAAAPPP